MKNLLRADKRQRLQCAVGEEIPEFLFVAPPRHSLQAISALGLIATLVSLGMTYRRLGSEHQEGQMPTSLLLLGMTV